MIETNLYTQLDRLNLNVNSTYKSDILDFKDFIGKKYSKDYIIALSKEFGTYYIQIELYNMFNKYREHLRACSKYEEIEFFKMKINRYNGNIPYGYITELDKDIVKEGLKIDKD